MAKLSEAHKIAMQEGRKRATTKEITTAEALSGFAASARPQITARLEEMPSAYRRNYLRAMAGKRRSEGVKAFCLMCVGWLRADVKSCTAVACPLYPYRPYQK